ncbi:MAG: outer membrane protein transport protein [Flavobacteriales bacterium]|jgi:hypothetical protein|nr:outer membrane protein transport protein [Flavobacteriales bacterium]
MNRIIILVVAVFAMAFCNAQNSTDGLRYGVDRTYGTARFQGMSGAFGALGGDLSAIGINPAGSAVFLQNNASVSFSVFDRENDATYFNTETRSIDTDVSLNQAGLVFVFDTTNEESPWKKFTLGLNFDSSQNYNDELFVIGTGNTSISEFFLAQAQGFPLNLLELRPGESIADLYTFLGETEGVAAQNAFLGYQGFIFDPVDPNNQNNTQYTSNVAPGSFNQEYAYFTEGYNGKYTLNLATQYTNDFFFGINLNSHVIDYRRSTFLFETNSNTGSSVNQIGFENNLSVLGTGFSAQVGAIAKLNDKFRLGLTYDTPTWYVISEETSQALETRRVENGQNIFETVNPRVINVFEDYELRTPGKVMASAAYVFGKSGLISFDYSYKDYSNTKFSPSNDPVFIGVNSEIDNRLKATSTYRLGGEYRINNMSLRGGYHFEESPYKDETTVGDLNGFSLGAGYNFGNYTFDVAYARSEQSREQQLYNVGLTDSASIETTYSTVVFTLGFRL